jgi:Cytochrome c oxidase subunit IIa family
MANENADAKAEEHATSYDERGFVVRKTFTDGEFRPKGAIAFFVVLVLLCAAIWFTIYYIQLMRQ